MIRRGAILIRGERSRLGSKPRPWLVIQSDAFNPTHPTVTCCMISTFHSDPGHGATAGQEVFEGLVSHGLKLGAVSPICDP